MKLTDAGSSKPVMSEDQLLDRDEAIHGPDAPHILDQKERGDTVIDANGLQEVNQAQKAENVSI